MTAEPAALESRSIKQFKYRSLRSDMSRLKSLLSAAPLEKTVSLRPYISLPLPDGSMVLLFIEESPVMAPGLAEKFPEFKTYKVRSADNAAITGRLDLVSTGFHGYLNTEKGVVFIDPELGSTERYRSFYKEDVPRTDKDYLRCSVTGEQPPLAFESSIVQGAQQKSLARSSNELLTYRLAVAATQEYSQAIADFLGVPVNNTNTQAEIVTAINRVNEMYERDLAIRLELVTENNLLISSNVSDFNNDDPFILIGESTAYIDGILTGGSSAYDIGHVFSTGAGGLATLGAVCGSFKAEGVTGIPNPTGDAFYIDFVAHEIGHQFGANHTFNGTDGSCGGGNRNAATAFEPGSGTTIMAYAGICDAENVQASSATSGGISDDTFHAGSISEIVSFTRTGTGGDCDVLTVSGNTAPVADAGGMEYTIPGQTPFELTASATDVNSDTLTYQWDQMDAGLSTNPTTFGSDLGNNALFRSFAPSTNPVRTLPRIETIVSGVNDKAERLPSTDRALNFRLTVRDQNGGVDDADMTLTVDKDSGPFVVLSATTAVTLDITQPQVIEWATACTDQAPVSCANVDILLSTDSGASFPELLATTPNDGEEIVTLPAAVTSTTALIKIACTDNVFFDVNDALIILEDGTGTALISTGAGNNNCTPGVNGGGIGTAAATFDVTNATVVDLTNNIVDSVSDTGNVNDVFQFTGTAEVYTFLLTGFGNSDLDLYLVDSTGKVLIQSSGTGTSETIKVTLVEGVTYNLVVSAVATGGTAENYTVTSSRSEKATVVAADDGSSALNLWFLAVMLACRSFYRRSRAI